MLVNGSVALLEKDFVKHKLRLSLKYKEALGANILHVSKEAVFFK